jgi:hypothetical protein
LKNIPMESVLGKFTSDIAFPAYIAKQLDRVVAKPAESTILGQMYDKALKVWRTQATVLRPGFHSTNLQGNMFNGAYLAGMLNPKRFLEAATWDKIKSGANAVGQKIGNYTIPEVDQFMERFGVGGAGHSFTNELMEDGADKVLLAKLEGQEPGPQSPDASHSRGESRGRGDRGLLQARVVLRPAAQGQRHSRMRRRRWTNTSSTTRT